MSSKKDISNSFKSHFINISKPNNMDRVEKLNSDFDRDYAKLLVSHESSCNCSSCRISLDVVIDATFSLKKGKSMDDDMITAEHFFNAPLSLFDRLTGLFNAMLQHSCVPRQFQLGTIVPIVKDRQGSLGDPHNYRGITKSAIMSKIFEHALRVVFGQFLTTSAYQFGFKRKSSTSHALFCLKETVEYYTDRGSNVYCSFLDASKAFDRLVHSGLFLKLMRRHVPLIFLDLLIYWYSDLQCRVRWGEEYSDWFIVLAGVRQGGVLSPDLYCLYIDDLVTVLSKLNIGCYMKNIFISSLLYADDMALISPSIKGLQLLLSACEQYCIEWDISLNHKKTKNMAFGNNISDLCHLVLDGKHVDWVQSWKYLGVTLNSHWRFDCDVDERIQSFYKCLNAILRIEGRSGELVMLRLLESHCLPILTYAIEVIHVDDEDKRRKLRVAYNAIFRKIFEYRRSDSVRELQMFLERPTWEDLISKRKAKFLLNLKANGITSLFTR